MNILSKSSAYLIPAAKPQITVRVTNNYGNQVIYPDCPTSNTFAAMLGQKTLTRNDLRYIEKLGYGVNVSQPEPITL